MKALNPGDRVARGRYAVRLVLDWGGFDGYLREGRIASEPVASAIAATRYATPELAAAACERYMTGRDAHGKLCEPCDPDDPEWRWRG